MSSSPGQSAAGKAARRHNLLGSPAASHCPQQSHIQSWCFPFIPLLEISCWYITVQVVLSFWGLNRCPIKIFYLEFPSLHPKMFFSDGNSAHSIFSDGRREISLSKMSAGLGTKPRSLVPLVPPRSPPSQSGCCVEIHSQWLQYLMHNSLQNKLKMKKHLRWTKRNIARKVNIIFRQIETLRLICSMLTVERSQGRGK